MNPLIFKGIKYSKHTVLLIALIWIILFIQQKKWHQNLVVNDVVSYYGYLPAFFIYDDITLKFTDKNPPFFGKYFWPELSPNGGRVIKTTMGLSILYAPFFLVGHATAPLFDQPRDGFSWPYQFWVLAGCLVYLLIGLCFLRKTLLLYFTDSITAFTLLSVYFGTNLFWYSFFDGLMSHGYLFCLMSVFLFYVLKWKQAPSFGKSIVIGLVIGLATLSRPTLIIWILSPVLFILFSPPNVTENFKWLIAQWKYVLVIIFCFVLTGLPQMAYWKYITGHWLYFSYTGERFYFDNPHLLGVLFSFRKGWLLYFPLMAVALLGFYSLFRREKALFAMVLVPFFISYYVLSCWWSWWFGGSYGFRPFIEFYSFLSLPMASFFSAIVKKTAWIRRLVFLLSFILIIHGVFQTWQFYQGLIHWDFMTKEAYAVNFLKRHNSEEWWHSLKEPNNDRARKGLNEDYSLEELKKVQGKTHFNLKAWNWKWVCSEIGGNGELTASRDNLGEWEAFRINWLPGNKVALRNVKDKYWSCDPLREYGIFADKDTIGPNETFVLEYAGDSYLYLKAFNGKYLQVQNEWPCTLKAVSDVKKFRERIRIWLE